MSLYINLPIEAKPQGSKTAYVRGGRAVLVEASRDLKTIRAQASKMIAQKAMMTNWVKAEPQQPIEIAIMFGMTRPRTVKRAWHSVKPDLDKLIRFCLDAVTQSEAVWQDDAQVITITASKVYADKPFIQIEVLDAR